MRSLARREIGGKETTTRDGSTSSRSRRMHVRDRGARENASGEKKERSMFSNDTVSVGTAQH